MIKSTACAVAAALCVALLGQGEAWAVDSLRKRVTTIETQTPGGMKVCTEGQIPKYLGGVWKCADDLQGGGGTLSPQLVAVDSTGATIGPIIDSAFGGATSVLAVVELGGAPYPLPITRSGYVRIGDLFFTTSNCTGTPYSNDDINFGGVGIFPVTVVSEPGNSLYGQIGDRTQITAASRRQLTGECIVQSFPFDGYPLGFLVNLDTLFTPPFRAALQ